MILPPILVGIALHIYSLKIMAKTDYKSIDEYHSAFPDEVRLRMERTRLVIKEVAPEAIEVISYQIPAFKIGNKFLIYYAGFARHITLSSPWSDAFLKAFQAELELMKVSKSAIQFPNDKPLPIETIRRMVEFRREELG